MEGSVQTGDVPQHLDMPARVYISKQSTFDRAMKLLSLKIHEARAIAVGNDQVIGSVCIDFPARGEHPALHRKQIFGDYKMTQEDALESAMLAALLYLQQNNSIVVDDINLDELTKCRTKLTESHHKLLTASSWANLFQEQAESLKLNLEAAREENKKLVNAAKAFGVKEEVLAAHEFDLKPNVVPLKNAGAMKDVATPLPAKNQLDHSSLSQREKRCYFRGPSAKKTLFKK